MKLLYLLRHAKSSWAQTGLDDRDRPLAPRGRRSARRMARFLADQRVSPALVLCSPALRARETLELVRPGLPEAVRVLVEEGLYGADVRALLRRLRRLPETASTVMVVGHNPGLQELAGELASRGADLDRLRARFPTAALAVLTVSAAKWREMTFGEAELVDLVEPKRLG